MPRNREKTTNRGTTSESTMQKAAQLCLDNLNMSERAVAAKFNINHVTLNRYLKKFKLHRETGSCLPAFGYQPYNKIFDDFQEKQLADYVKISADMYFGLNNRNIRQLAYEFAVKLDLTVPKSWKHNKEAGPDWITDYLKRNPSVSSYLAKVTKISRANHFNPANFKHFMDKYESILLKYKFQAHDVYNMDEIKITYFQKTRKIVASRGNKLNIKAIKSGKSSSITMCLAINAAGNVIPPMYTISKTANNLNCVQGVEFLKLLKTFAKYVRPSVDNKVLILLDNHVSHLYLPVIDFCREAGILLLSFPPNCFHKLQPLNTSVFTPFSQFLKENMAVWLQNNPEMALRTHDVPLVSSSASALVSAATPQNIINGFSLSGIWPLKRDEFMPAVFADTDDRLIDNDDEESIDYVIREPNNSMTEEPVNNIDITPHVTTEGSLTRHIIDLQQSASEISQEDIKPFIKQELQDKNVRKTEGNLTYPIIDLQQSASEISQEDIKPFIKQELQDKNVRKTEGNLTYPIIDLQQSASEISQEDIKPFIKQELQDKNVKKTEGSLTHLIIDLQQSGSEISQEDIKAFIKQELQDKNVRKTEENLTHPIIDLQQSGSEILQEDIKPFIKLELQDKNVKNEEIIRKGKITKLIYMPKKLEIEDKTKNHAKRKLGFKNEMSKKSKS
ncbi:uncharacterized protein LOC111033144 [Myzus persicae]|uniref:uncharacterized protein LOC111033144 n=1 Tax=Myzus persicae TaxID=13164 RepID=UPI000B9377FA|nr:uncharacterized protein LOC111033144 [Myzus persicae]